MVNVMIIDEKGRLFGKISIIDILFVVILIAAIAGVGYKFTRSKTASPFIKTDLIEVEFLVQEAPDFVVNAMKIGDPTKEGVQSTPIGPVTNLEVGPPYRFIETDKGEVVPAAKEGHSSVVVTVQAHGFFGNNGVTINNIEYYIGRTLVVYVGNTAAWGYVSDLRKIK